MELQNHLLNSYMKLDSLCILVARNMNVSGKNKHSRSCLTTGHRGGSKSFIRHLADMADPESQQEPSQIELYKNTHYNEKKGWISLQAEENYERMCELQSEPPQEGSSPLTEQQIFDKVLGVRRGYNRGLGHGQAAPSSNAGGGYVNVEMDQLTRRAADAESQLKELRNSTQERMNAQQQEMGAQKARIDEQQRATCIGIPYVEVSEWSLIDCGSRAVWKKRFVWDLIYLFGLKLLVGFYGKKSTM